MSARQDRREDTTIDRGCVDLKNNTFNNDALDATEQEHNLGFVAALKLYPKAVGWSLILSTAIIMQGYDTALLANFFAIDSFSKNYGTLQPDGTYVVSASWRSGLTNGEACGEILGLWIAGIVQQRLGYKKTMIGALALSIGSIFITFFAVNLPMLLAGEIICGILWGVFPASAMAYASDVCPVALRAYLTTYVNLCWVFGELMAAGVLSKVLERNDQWAYRIPFALQWLWPIPIILGVLFAPESPYWLVQHGKIKEARQALVRLTSRGDTGFDANKAIAMIQHTNEIEIEASAGTSYLDCVKGTNLRRTEISACVWLIQQFCGSGLMTYSTVFFVQAGLSTSAAFDMSMGMYGLGAVGTILSWWMLASLGRRTLYLSGCCICFVLMLVTGFCGIAPASNTAASWAIGSLLLVFTFVYDLTLGPVCYALVAEIPSTRLKTKTIVITRMLYNAAAITMNVIVNYQMTSTAWDWNAKSGFFWAGTCFLCCVWSYFRLPEPRGRTYAELDILFERGVSARKFKTAEINLFEDYELAIDGTSVVEVTAQEDVKGKNE